MSSSAKPADRHARLTPNFRLSEFIRPEDPLPPAPVLENIARLAERLQVVRDLFNAPVTVTSGYRTPQHNRAVGGAPNSMHLVGMAADIVVSGVPAREVQRLLTHWSGGMGGYAHYTHLDIRPTRARW